MQRLRRVGETSGAFARVLLPEKLLIHTERCEMRRDLCVLAGICVLLAAPAAMSQSDPQRPAESPSQQPPIAEEKASLTHHSARIGGQEIKYNATAATYHIKADDGTPKATMFYVAYTKEGVTDIAKRPISFVYNGGPGA